MSVAPHSESGEIWSPTRRAWTRAGLPPCGGGDSDGGFRVQSGFFLPDVCPRHDRCACYCAGNRGGCDRAAVGAACAGNSRSDLSAGAFRRTYAADDAAGRCRRSEDGGAHRSGARGRDACAGESDGRGCGGDSVSRRAVCRSAHRGAGRWCGRAGCGAGGIYAACVSERANRSGGGRGGCGYRCGA